MGGRQQRGPCFSPLDTSVSNSIKSLCLFYQREATQEMLLMVTTINQAQFLPSGSFESINQTSDPLSLPRGPLHLPRAGCSSTSLCCPRLHVLGAPPSQCSGGSDPPPQAPATGASIQPDPRPHAFVTGHTCPSISRTSPNPPVPDAILSRCTCGFISSPFPRSCTQSSNNTL